MPASVTSDLQLQHVASTRLPVFHMKLTGSLFHLYAPLSVQASCGHH